jgi:hypothetical protein
MSGSYNVRIVLAKVRRSLWVVLGFKAMHRVSEERRGFRHTIGQWDVTGFGGRFLRRFSLVCEMRSTLKSPISGWPSPWVFFCEEAHNPWEHDRRSTCRWTFALYQVRALSRAACIWRTCGAGSAGNAGMCGATGPRGTKILLRDWASSLKLEQKRTC